MENGTNRESLLITVFAIFVMIVIFFVAGADRRGDLNMGFLLGLLFSYSIITFRKKN